MNILSPQGRSIIRAGGLPPTIWSPLSLSPYLWFDANDTATLYDTTTGGSQVTTNGTIVRRWEDKSGNGWHMNAGPGNPTLVTSAYNGKSALNFSGLGSLHSTIGASGINLREFIVAVVYLETSKVNNSGIFSLGTTGIPDYGNANSFELDAATTANACQFFHNVAGLQFTGLQTISVNSIIIRATGTTMTPYNNGFGYSSIANAAGTSVAGFGVGDRYLPSSWGGTAGRKFIGRVCEIIVAPANNVSSVYTLNAYLRAKWGILSPYPLPITDASSIGSVSITGLLDTNVETQLTLTDSSTIGISTLTGILDQTTQTYPTLTDSSSIGSVTITGDLNLNVQERPILADSTTIGVSNITGTIS